MHKFTNIEKLVVIIRHRFKFGQDFTLACTNREFYVNMLSRHLENAKFEIVDEGIIVRKG